MRKTLRRVLWRDDGATSTSAWLAGRYRISRGTAREWVRVARDLERLPEVRRAYGAGEISWDQLRPLVRLAIPEDEERWAEEAPARSPASLWREVDRRARLAREEAEEARRMRYLSVHRDHERPIVWLEGALPAEEGAALEAAVCRRAEQVAVEEGLPDPQGARMADALCELVAEGRGGGDGATLVVHADAAALLDGGDAGGPADPHAPPLLSETESGMRLICEAIRRIACDARVEWVLEGPDGRPVGIGRQGRSVPGWLDRLLRHRDPTCRFPGCGRRRFLVAHHLVHWGDGGPTDLDNLARLCGSHHRLIHEGGWRTSGHPGRELRFHRPDGRPLERSPALGAGVRARGFP